jgi:hypothetical protein
MKVTDLATLYHFQKGYVGFLSTDFAINKMLPLEQVFQAFPLKILNNNLHESCVPQQDGQISKR